MSPTLETLTLTQISFIVSIIITVCVAYFLRYRCKEFIYLFSILAGLVTMVCFTHWPLIAKTFIVAGYLMLLVLCLILNSIETPEDSLLNEPEWFDKNHLRAS